MYLVNDVPAKRKTFWGGLAGSMVDVLAAHLLTACQPAQAASSHALQGCLVAAAAAVHEAHDRLQRASPSSTPLAPGLLLPEMLSSQPSTMQHASPLTSAAPASGLHVGAADLRSPSGRTHASMEPAAVAASPRRRGSGECDDCEHLPVALRYELVGIANEWTQRVLKHSGQSRTDLQNQLHVHEATGAACPSWLSCLRPVICMTVACPTMRIKLFG